MDERQVGRFLDSHKMMGAAGGPRPVEGRLIAAREANGQLATRVDLTGSVRLGFLPALNLVDSEEQDLRYPIAGFRIF